MADSPKDVRSQTLEAVRRDARRVENTLDQKLVSYSKFSAHFTQETLLGEGPPATSAIGNTDTASQSMAIELQDLLRELTDINERLASCLTEADRTHSTAAAHAVQHHRGRLREYEKDFRTIRTNIEQAKAQAELLSTVRKDISQYKQGGDGADHLLRERSAIGGATDELSRVLSSAVQNRDALAGQRGTLDATMGKLRAAAALLPGVNQLLMRIRRRKARDMIIVGAVTVVFALLLFLYHS